MLANVLQSDTAMRASVEVVRAFVRMREFLAFHKDLAAKLEELEGRLSAHDGEIHALFNAIRRLMSPRQRTKQQIGFQNPS